MLSDLAKTLKVAGAMVATAAAIACASPAQAAVIQGEWDPAFGSPFSDYGWNGSFSAYVPDACRSTVPSSGDFELNSTNCSGMYLASGTVGLYLLSDLSHSPIGGSPLIFNTGTLSSVSFSGGVMTGVVGGFFGQWKQSSIFADGVTANDGTAAQFELSFSGLPVLQWQYLSKCEVDDDTCKKQVFAQVLEDCKENSGYTPTSGENAPSWSSLAFVPEPGSLALMLPALGMLAVFRRRKSAAA